MNWKTNYNIPEVLLDDITHTFKTVLPLPNKTPESYYETKKLTRSLGFPCHKIDVCEDNCMLFWKEEDRGLVQCRFCGKARYQSNVGRSGKKIPKQRMFYQPIADRLKQLYQSKTTASQLRWHAEHLSPEGEMHHPSDGKVWKHFQKTYNVSRKENFKMRAALMWTISDFPAYGMLAGWMTHGRLACLYCMDETIGLVAKWKKTQLV
ncbi:unnamed protein product [Microthlaspi erraticum]|uniref:Uncharacterized protein n=1 Tax=Microthlaspi erraticum TaxID=1685480 RepID=A0A6D2JSQ7_9BRAS|nr:unnamed protein product [Microthlaspi erraticum]